MTVAERFEVRPKRALNILKLCGLLAFLVPLSVYAVLAGEDIVTRGIGVVGVLFFGVGGLFALVGMVRTPWSMAITPDALEVRTEAHVARIPWRDIEAVGLADVSGQKMPSLRLSGYDNYAASLSPEALATFKRRWGAMRLAAGATMVLAKEKSLAGHASASDLTAVLQANRDMTGYDISFAWNQLDRPAARFSEWLEAEWRARR